MASPTHENLGLTIDLWAPTFTLSGSDPTAATVDVWTTHLATFNAPTQLSWSIQANGGYQTCTWAITGAMPDLERWLEEGLGAHVEIRDETDMIRWEGRVNQIQATAGGLRWTWGPLLSIANQVAVRYNVVDTSTTPPTSNEQAWYGWAEQADSQARYGIAPKILSAGDMTLASATAVATTWAQNEAWPKMSSDVALGAQAGQVQVQFQAAGYYMWLSYPYAQTAATGAILDSTKVAAILDADPNGFFTSANADISPSVAAAHNVAQYEGQDRAAWDLIAECGYLLDTNIYRSIARVGVGRHFTFQPAQGYDAATGQGQDLDYLISLGESGHWQVRTANGALVRPWAVDAGTFAMLTDLLPGRDFMNTVVPYWWQQDPRLMFIERVQFTAPDQVQLQSGLVTDPNLAIKRWGLGGLA